MTAETALLRNIIYDWMTRYGLYILPNAAYSEIETDSRIITESQVIIAMEALVLDGTAIVAEERQLTSYESCSCQNRLSCAKE